MEAMQAQTVDVIKRMKEITLVMQTPEQELENQGVTPDNIEGNQYTKDPKLTENKMHFIELSFFSFLKPILTKGCFPT